MTPQAKCATRVLLYGRNCFCNMDPYNLSAPIFWGPERDIFEAKILTGAPLQLQLVLLPLRHSGKLILAL